MIRCTNCRAEQDPGNEPSREWDSDWYCDECEQYAEVYDACEFHHPSGPGPCTRKKGHDGDHITQHPPTYTEWTVTDCNGQEGTSSSEHEGVWKEPS